MYLKMKKSSPVTIFLNGEAVQIEVSRSTSCDDVIKMVTKKILWPVGSQSFAIFESGFDVQKRISGQTKLLKHVRSRGATKQNYTLEMKEFDQHKSKMAPLCLAKSEFQRFKSRKMKTEIKANKNIDTYLKNNINERSVFEKSKKNYDKNITGLNEADGNPPTVLAKRELLERYLSDSFDLNTSFCVTNDETFLPIRTSGEGSDITSLIVSELPERTSGDGEEDMTEDDLELNKAFLVEDTLGDDMAVDVKDELNECVVHDEYECIFDAESELENDSDYDSIDDLERNILESSIDDTYIKIENIKIAFSTNDLNYNNNEDDMLESFMNTFVNDDSGDEGVSSIGSDFD